MIGQQISHYRIAEKIGHGGMGVVYRALDTRLNRSVALKFLPEHLLDDETAKKRFITEAQASSAIEHPNIITIHEIDEVEGRTFICMEYIEGKSLAERLTREIQLPISEALSVATDVAEALVQAHKKEIIHRDIKPGNILITEDGRTKVTDFGLAKLRDMSTITEDGAAVGTFAYMSPEQARAEETNSRTDIYSLGLVLFEITTGTYPFEATSPLATLKAKEKGTIRSVRELRERVPEAIEAILQRALAPTPANRYEAMEEFLVDLKKVKDSLSRKAEGEPESIVRRVVLPLSTNRLILATALYLILAFFLLKGVTALTWWYLLPQGLLDGVFVIILGGFPITLILSYFHGAHRKILAWKTEVALLGTATVMILSALLIVLYSAVPLYSGELGRVLLFLVPTENATGDPAPDQSLLILNELLYADLRQSRYIRPFDPALASTILESIGVEAGKPITHYQLMRAAHLVNGRWVLRPQLSKRDSAYTLTIYLIDGRKRTLLTTVSETIEIKEALAETLDQPLAQLKQAIGLPDDFPGVPHPLSSSEEALTFYQKGVELLYRGENRRAIEFLEVAIDEDPQFIMAYAKLSEAWEQIGYDGKAQEYIDRAATLAIEFPERLTEPDRLSLLAKKAQLFYDLETAKQYFLRVKELFKGQPDPAVFLSLAEIYETLGDYEAAINICQQAIEQDPGYLPVYLEFGLLLTHSMSFEDALRTANQAREKSQEFGNQEGAVRALLLEGEIHRAKGQHFGLLLEQQAHSKNGEQAELRAKSHAEYDTAASLYEEAIRVSQEIGYHPGVSQGYYRLGFLSLLEMGEVETAREEGEPVSQKFLDLKKKSLGYFQSSSLPIAQMANDEETIARLYLTIAQVHRISGDFAGDLDKSTQFLEKALEIAQTLGNMNIEAVILYEFGVVYWRQEKFEQAYQFVEKAYPTFVKMNDKIMEEYAAHLLKSLAEQVKNDSLSNPQ